MRLIVLGAGPVGEQLVGLAVDGGHQVTLIEADEQRAEHCAQRYDITVLHAPIDEEGILEEAGANQTHALIATTEDDSTNLMAMVLGQEHEIESLTSTVNARHRKRLFDRLGVNTLVDPEVLIARHLLDLVLHPSTQGVTSLTGNGQLYELRLSEECPLLGRTLGDIHEQDMLPEHLFIAHIERDEQPINPREDVALEEGDHLFVFSRQPLSQDDLRLFDRNAS